MQAVNDDITIDGKPVGLPAWMKRNQFVYDINGYTRKFTFFAIQSNTLFIGHRIQGETKLLTPVDFADINIWISYFDRI